MKKDMIVICGLDDNFNLKVGGLLSEALDMFLLDLKKLLEYEIVKKNEIIETLGIDYLKKLEFLAVKKASTFENTLIVADYDNFIFQNNYKLFKKRAIIIYIKFPKSVLLDKKNVIANLNILNFASRSKELENISNFVVSAKNNTVENIKNKIIKQLKEVFL